MKLSGLLVKPICPAGDPGVRSMGFFIQAQSTLSGEQPAQLVPGTEGGCKMLRSAGTPRQGDLDRGTQTGGLPDRGPTQGPCPPTSRTGTGVLSVYFCHSCF